MYQQDVFQSRICCPPHLHAPPSQRCMQLQWMVAVKRLQPPCSVPHLTCQNLLQRVAHHVAGTAAEYPETCPSLAALLGCSEPLKYTSLAGLQESVAAAAGAWPPAPCQVRGAGASCPLSPAQAQAHDQAANAQPTCCLTARGMLTAHDSFSHQHDACAQTLLD